MFFGGVWGCVLVGVWGGYVGVCFARIFVVFWSGLEGKNELTKLKNKRIDKIILILYFVFFNWYFWL